MAEPRIAGAAADGSTITRDDINNNDDVAPHFHEDFKKYIHNELCWEKNKTPNSLMSTEYVSWTFWSRENGKPECPPPPHDEFWEFFSQQAPIWANLKFDAKILAACRDIVYYSYQEYPLLVQFWEHKTMEDRSFLTCQHQPFALQSIHKGMDIEGLCSFRIISKDYKFYVDGKGKEELGLPGRVFLHGSPESSPNVEYYSLREYPLRDHALRCQVRSSFAFPVFEPPRQTCVGVLELLSTARGPLYEYRICSKALEKLGLCSDAPEHISIQRWTSDSEGHGLNPAVNAILAVSKEVCKVHELRLANIWVPCWLCYLIVDCDFTIKNLLMLKSHELMENDQDAGKFSYACTHLHLRKGQGVAGSALLSSKSKLIYCTDVSQFTITEYPLAHFAQEYGFSGCFGIYLQSPGVGNGPCILEFFFPASYAGSVVDTNTLLRDIWRTMKKNFQSFKLACGADLTEELPIEVIDIQNNKTSTDFVVPVPVPSQNGGDQMMLLDSMAQESMDVIDNGRNIDVIRSQTKGTIKKSAGREPKKTTGVRIPIRLGDILKASKMRLKDAAKKLDVSTSTLKRACRYYDIPRWPPRKTVELSPSRPSESPPLVDDQEQIPQLNSDVSSINHPSCLDDQEQISQLNSDVPSNHHAHATVDADNVTIKAKYGKYFIMFELSLSSTMEELRQEVAKRLKLEVETYDIVYEHEGGLVLIACNEDLQLYIRTYRSQNATSLEMLIEPK